MKVFIIAGEPSGDLLGGALMSGLHTCAPGVTFEGIGGPQMQAQGLASLFDMSELSVMGIAEILPKFRHLMRRINQTAEAVLAAKPDVLITIDSPDFSLRVAKRVKTASDIRVVHYVAPTVWAWRPGRAAKMARYVDHVLALFPFEPPYMEAAGMDCDFVGHPVVAKPVPTPVEARSFRQAHGLEAAEPVLLVLPGSRRGEVLRLGPVLGTALKRVAQVYPDLRVIVPAAAPVAGDVLDLVRAWPGRPLVLDPRDRSLAEVEAEKRTAFAAAHAALAVSGTVALELAAAGTPMVSAFDLSWLSRQIIQRMVRIDTGNLVNIVSETRHVPEFIGNDCRPGPIADGLIRLLENPQPQLDAMAVTMQRLGQGGQDPGLRAAKAVLAGLGRNVPPVG